MRIKYYFFVLSIHSLCFPLDGTSQSTVRMHGLISDSETSRPLEYAHIGMMNSNLGTVSNSLGQFSLMIPERYRSGELVLTYLGYKTLSISLDTINDFSDVSNYYLEPDPISLAEVVIRADKKSIVEQAIEAIPVNYDLDEMVLEGFWRAQIQDKNNTIQLSESALEIYRVGERYNKRDVKMKILKGRLSRDSTAFDSLHNFQAGVTPSSLFKASFLLGHSLLSKKVLKNHDYNLKDITTYNDHRVYIIEFDRKRKFKKTGYKGTMLIDTESLAFVQISFDLSYDIGEEPKLFDDAKLAGMITGLSESTLNKVLTELNYYENNGKWYLSHARYDAVMELIKSKISYQEPINYYADFIITDIAKENMILPSAAEFAKNSILEYQFEEIDGDFWKDYNYLVPDKDFDRMFTEISQKNAMKSIR